MNNFNPENTFIITAGLVLIILIICWGVSDLIQTPQQICAKQHHLSQNEYCKALPASVTK